MNPNLFGPEAWGPLASAWMAFHQGDADACLSVHGDDGETEPLPVSLFFRTESTLRPADRAALSLVRGTVLDVGAGVGALTLILQRRGVPVTALEVVPEGVGLMRARGVEEVLEGRLETLDAGLAFDSLLLLMNGTALAGTLSAFPSLLASLERHLAPGGQVLMDSTDLTGGGESAGKGVGVESPAADLESGYPGELHYQIEFQGVRGAPFPQLFLDPATLAGIAGELGWATEIVWEEGPEFLTRLTRSP